MSAQLRFSTPRFVVADETLDAAQPAGGGAVLAWLAERLSALGLVRDAQVVPAGKHWRLDVEVFGEPYQLGCVGSRDENWALTVVARRGVVDRLLDRRVLTADDALLRIVVEILERQPDFASIELTID